MRDNLGWILFAGALLALVVLWFNPKREDIALLNASKDTDDDQVKCQLRDAYGRTITLTGSPTDQNFINMCQSRTNQQIYVYGYPYYFIRHWRPRHNPAPAPPPEA